MTPAEQLADLRRRIIALHDQHFLRRSALSIREGGGVFERVFGDRSYSTILEIGTYRGVGAAALSLFCDRVITIDLQHGRMEQLGETWDRAEFWRALGIGNIEFHAVKDDAEKAALINGLHFDAAFIDGAHDATVADDFALVRRCGTVLFHDYDRRGRPEQDYVCDFVDSLPREQVTPMDIYALWSD